MTRRRRRRGIKKRKEEEGGNRKGDLMAREAARNDSEGERAKQDDKLA